MIYNDNLSIFDRYKIANTLSNDPNVQLDIQRDMILSRMKEQEREEQIIDRIVDRVIQRISVSTDIQKAIMEIKELKKALDSLGK